MIVSFSVSNFRSFSEEQTFSLIASTRLMAQHEDHAVPVPESEEKALRAAVLYGANGAGKSNLFKALRFLRTLALRTREKEAGTGREPFRLGDSDREPSQLDLQFICGEKLYRFGVKVDDRRISEEWLTQVSAGHERILYERATDEAGNTTVEGPGLDKRSKKLSALVTVGAPDNQTFLATVRANLNPPEAGDPLLEVINWLGDSLVLIGPDEIRTNIAGDLESDGALLKFAGTFLKNASTGVDRLEVRKVALGEEEAKTILSPKAMDLIRERNRKGEMPFRVPLNFHGGLVVERDEHGEQYYRTSIEAAHERQTGNVVPLPIESESDGTQRLLHLIPALYHLKDHDGVFFIDEIDRSLHPILVKAFLEAFLRTCGGGKRQIIVTTHESNLLDQELLRRDEIWFAEKDQNGATHLYSLADFKVRKDLEIRKHYLQGRFGAIPFLGSIEQLVSGGGTA